MTILAGLLVLLCAGMMVTHGYHMFRHKETPKKDTEHHMAMPREHDHGQAAGTSQEGIPDGQAKKDLDQETVKEDQPKP